MLAFLLGLLVVFVILVMYGWNSVVSDIETAIDNTFGDKNKNENNNIEGDGEDDGEDEDEEDKKKAIVQFKNTDYILVLEEDAAKLALENGTVIAAWVKNDRMYELKTNTASDPGRLGTVSTDGAHPVSLDGLESESGRQKWILAQIGKSLVVQTINRANYKWRARMLMGPSDDNEAITSFMVGLRNPGSHVDGVYGWCSESQFECPVAPIPEDLKLGSSMEFKYGWAFRMDDRDLVLYKNEQVACKWSAMGNPGMYAYVPNNQVRDGTLQKL